ncbi:DoxX family protein [Pedobacter sp. MC2016-14]|uniref:DoxX family protein n=1 Tax=Pedobacter sp. MC2016-14 TaxID=2897327 RepID=UPI001E454BFD|nr:DoxX family protein [Pedobacter sp. MC2016-14]MCD0488689.1 DoxX family protein [Pedobacter sp. MC2016-14]
MSEIINPSVTAESREWKGYEKNLFRFFFIFLIIQIIPLDWKFYHKLFTINWFHLHFHDLFELSKYQPQFFTNQEQQWYAGSFINWALFAVLAAIGTAIWAKADTKRKEYRALYYWLRVLVRYRLAFVLVTYGFIKFFPLQMPYPSLSNLLTNYGDYFAWKIYFQTVGIAPKYESFLGFVEILAAFLLFNRRTVTFGVGLIFGFLGNVAVANGFYDIGEPVLSTFIVVLAAFLFVYDIPRLFDLLVREVPAKANRFRYQFTSDKLKRTRLILRSVFILFVVLFAYKAYDNYTTDPYKIPHTPGLSNAYGYYRVQQFVLNKDTIPYSKTDSNRWQDVVFEKWSTLTIKVNRPVKIDFSSAEDVHEHDIDRNYELAGYAGRHYFYYDADTVKHTLSLQNKNKNHRSEKLFLTYKRPNDSTIVLSGLNEKQDSIHVVLAKINKKYMMFEGRRKPVKI